MNFEVSTVIHVYLYVCLFIYFILNLIPDTGTVYKMNFSLAFIAILFGIIYYLAFIFFTIALIKYGSVLSTFDIILICLVGIITNFVRGQKVVNLRKKLK